MASARKMGFAVGVTLLFLLGMTSAWTTMSPPMTIGRNNDAIRSILCIQMSGSASEGGGGSYEEQYNAFANQKKEPEDGPRIVPQPNQTVFSATKMPNQTIVAPTKMHLENAKRVDPIRKQSSSKQEMDRKAQDELEMAFLEFISCYPTKNGPATEFMKPPEEPQSKERAFYTDIPTSEAFEALLKQKDEKLVGGVTDDDIVTVDETESSAPGSTSLSTESNPPEVKEDVLTASTESLLESISRLSESIDGTESSPHGSTSFSTESNTHNDTKDDVVPASTKEILDSISRLSESIVASANSLVDNDIDIDIGKTTSKRPSLSVSKSSVENLESEITNSDDSENATEIANSDDTGIVGGGDFESKAAPPDSDSSTNDDYFTIEVKVETTFPSGITVEDAKTGWLEFCWAKGGGIVVPIETTPESDSSSTNTGEAPASIKFESKGSRTKARQEAESTSETPELLDIPTGIPSARELIVPLGLKQELVSSTSILDEIQDNTIRRDVVTYKTTQRGFFCKDMIEGTHEGRVEFIGASYTSTRMIWTVTFQVEEDEASSAVSTLQESPATNSASNVIEFASNTKTMVEDYSKQFMDSNPGLKSMMSKSNLWGSWSQYQLKTASQNLMAYLDNSADSVPVMEHTEILPVGVSPREAMEIWYDYYWKNGGGTLPVVMSPTKSSEKRWVIPAALEEELVSIEYDHPVSESLAVGVDGKITTETEIAKAVYRVNNPNLLTYPVYYNQATVRFVRDGEGNPTQLFWKVKVKPYRKFLGGGVQFWTKNGISLAARNLRNYIELKQLEVREKEIQAQLERLRVQKPDSGVDSNADSDTEKETRPLRKTIRSTLSISSGEFNDSINEAKEGTPQKDDKKELQTPMNSSNTGVPDGTRTIAIPPRTIDDRATIQIDSSTHAVDDSIDEEFWQ